MWIHINTPASCTICVWGDGVERESVWGAKRGRENASAKDEMPEAMAVAVALLMKVAGVSVSVRRRPASKSKTLSLSARCVCTMPSRCDMRWYIV